MKILHTSDWHLGANSFEYADRKAEFRLALDAVVSIAEREKCSVVVVAGDIFDQQLPTAEAEKLYFRTLVELRQHGVREIFVLGGNHDSLSRLSAPGPLAEISGIHIVATCRPDAPESHVFELKEADGTPVAILCAVPFLSDGIRNRILSANDIEVPAEQREAAALKWLHDRVVAIAEERRGDRNLPIWLTGHLCLLKGETTGEDLVGGLHAYPEAWVPASVDAMWLGHIHRPGQCGRGWNCGSLVCINFKDAEMPRQVYVWDTEAPKAPVAIPLPETQAIRTVEGATEAELKEALKRLIQEFPAKKQRVVFVQARNTSETFIPMLKEHLDAVIGKNSATVRLLRVKNAEKPSQLPPLFQKVAREVDLTPSVLFNLLLEDYQLEETEAKAVRATFGELMSSLAESDV